MQRGCRARSFRPNVFNIETVSPRSLGSTPRVFLVRKHGCSTAMNTFPPFEIMKSSGRGGGWALLWLTHPPSYYYSNSYPCG